MRLVSNQSFPSTRQSYNALTLCFLIIITATFLKFGFSSSQQRILAKWKSVLNSHREDFFNQVEFVDRMNLHQGQIQQAVAINSLAIPRVSLTPLSTSTASSSTSTINWPVHAVDIPQNFHFFGREDILIQVREVFKAPKRHSNPSTGPSCCVLHGLGGMGKSAIARQYIHQNAKDYDAIFWIRAETDTELSDSFCKKIARKLRLVDEGYTPASAIEEAKNWLEGTSNFS
jgi:hypothetical protein